jgi:hypothetical protein
VIQRAHATGDSTALYACMVFTHKAGMPNNRSGYHQLEDTLLL